MENQISIKDECVHLLLAHPNFRNKSDMQLLIAVRAVPGMVSRKTDMLVLPVCNTKGVVNRAMAIAVLLGTKQVG